MSHVSKTHNQKSSPPLYVTRIAKTRFISFRLQTPNVNVSMEMYAKCLPY